MILYKMTNDERIIKFTHNVYFKLASSISKKYFGDKKYSNIVKRVAMDCKFGQPWERVVNPPAYKTMHITDLQAVNVNLIKYLKNPTRFKFDIGVSNSLRGKGTGTVKPLISEKLINKVEELCG